MSLLSPLRWDLLRSQNNFAVGTNPRGISFDGANMWVANSGNNNVTKLRASDGANPGTFPAGSFTSESAFDGAHIGVVNRSGNNVTRLLPAFP